MNIDNIGNKILCDNVLLSTSPLQHKTVRESPELATNNFLEFIIIATLAVHPAKDS